MSETHECRCGRPTRDAAYVCDTCTQALSIALGEIPWLADELETTITRQRGVAYNGQGSKGAETPSPVHWGASEARTHLHAVLVSWTRFCADTGVRNASPHPGIPTDDLTAISRWLLWRVDGLALNDIGPDAVDEITEAVAKGKRVIDRPADKLYAGRCNAEQDNGEGELTHCIEDLYAKLGARKIVCRECATEWDVDERRAWLLTEAEEVLATAVEISRAVSWLGAEPLTADRLYQWAKRGRIVATGHDRKGRPMYRVGDAIDLLANSTRKASA